jgi:RNA polymerase sigma-70 factor (ECF subfamily)
MDSEDRSLVEAHRRGEHSAFTAIVIKHRQTIYQVARRMMGNHEDACDVTQEVFIRAFRGLRAFEGNASLRTWLYRIAVNLCLDHRGKLGRAPLLALEDEWDWPAPARESPGEVAEQRETRREIADAVGALPPRQRAAVVLRLFHDLPYAEIASVMGCTEGTVKATMFAAFGKLRARLRDLMPARPPAKETP